MSRKPNWGLSKSEQKFLRAHLRETGKWDSFVALRESLKNRDMPGGAAWLSASAQFGWVHHEESGRGHPKGDPCEECDSVTGATTDHVDTNTAPTPEDYTTTNGSSKPFKEPTFLAKSKLEMMPKEMAAEKPRQDITADVEWVTENLGVSGLKPEDAPSSRAWSWYIQALYDNNAYRMVMQHSTKLMPTGKQLEQEGKHGNLGTKRLAEFEAYLDSEESTRLLAADAVQQQGAQVAPTERVISQADLAIR
jgi:hypothetical protein